jgi:molecular chaperone DnaK (HSP70)
LQKEKDIKESDISEDSKQELRVLCEKQKTILSNVQSVKIALSRFVGSKHLNIDISRTQFEEICAHLFDQCIKHVETALE